MPATEAKLIDGETGSGRIEEIVAAFAENALEGVAHRPSGLARSCGASALAMGAIGGSS